MTRVAIVAASPEVRAALETVVSRSPPLVLTKVASSLRAVADDPAFASTEVVVLHATSVEVVRRSIEQLPPIPIVVVVSGPLPPSVVSSLVAVGARGVLTDPPAVEELTAAVDAAAAGLVALPWQLLGDLASPTSNGLGRGADVAGPPRARSISPLTRRELEVLSMLAEGLPNKSIASRLGISDHTVKTHVESVFEKLGASTRAEAVARGVRAGLLLL